MSMDNELAEHVEWMNLPITQRKLSALYALFAKRNQDLFHMAAGAGDTARIHVLGGNAAGVLDAVNELKRRPEGASLENS